MELKNIFSNLSPLDHRYFLSNREEHEALARSLSEEGAVRYQTAVEIALLKHLIPFAFTDKKEIARLQSEVEAAGRAVVPEDVYKEEEKTRHNIRALVNVLKRQVPAEVSRLVHVGATSVDILDTSFSLRLKDAVRGTLLPLLIRLEESPPRAGGRRGWDAPGRPHPWPVRGADHLWLRPGRIRLPLGKIHPADRNQIPEPPRQARRGGRRLQRPAHDHLRPRKARARSARLPRTRTVGAFHPTGGTRVRPRAPPRSPTPLSGSSPTWRTTCASCSARRSARCGRSSRSTRSVPRPCPRSAIPGTPST